MATKKAQNTDPTGYAEAMREVESILSELDSPSIDVDVLSTKVERASFLINWCKDRISSAQMTVDALVADLGAFEEDESDEDDFDDEDDEDEDDE
jgi:exodeoxyribonuclease VII small subunit